MVRDNSPKVRQRKQLERKRAKRAGYDRILIVSEGSKTEPNYFNEIRVDCRLQTANVEIHPGKLGTEPRDVVRYAQQLFEKGDQAKGIQAKAFEKIYVVFDRDEHRTYFEALDYVESLDGRLRNDIRQAVSFQVIASIPCFEVWLLLHFEEVQNLIHRDEVLRRLKRFLPNYVKGGNSTFATKKRFLEQASQRAKTLSKVGNARQPDMP